MDKSMNCCSMQLIDEDGTFAVTGIDNFKKQAKLDECGRSYSTVAILGPQSSGKSTLLNHLLDTNFREMDFREGRNQTTKGIWLAKCPLIEFKHCILVMDLEGTDAEQRQDYTTFEKRSALFALALSDIVLINMWCHDIGRENAANKPLLKTIFKVMMPLFSPLKRTGPPRTLIFVIRDKTKTPVELLQNKLNKFILEIWDKVVEEQALKETRLIDLFKVGFVALCNYEDKEAEFEREVDDLREKLISHMTLGDRKDVVPASEFLFSAQRIWQKIKENKDLDLPSHNVMVSTVRCDQIAEDIFDSFDANKEWLEFLKDVQDGPVPAFQKDLRSILHKCLLKYDEAVKYFDEGVKTKRRYQLQASLLKHVEPAFQLMLKRIRTQILNQFKEAFDNTLKKKNDISKLGASCFENALNQFDEECNDVSIKEANWDTTHVKNQLSCDMNAHILAAADACKDEGSKSKILMTVLILVRIGLITTTLVTGLPLPSI